MKLTEGQRKLLIPLALIGVLLIAFAIRAYRAGDPLGGYHAFNEGFYTNIASADLHRGAFDWFLAPLDHLNPPMYSLVVTVFFLIFGEGIAVARMVSILAGVAIVYYTFLLGRTLYTERIGLLAAAILAVTPGFALVNHNIQVDSLMLFFMIAGTYHYVHSIPGDDRKEALLGGVFMGLALATKMPAVVAPVVLALWEIWRTRGVKWVRGKRVLPFIGGMFALGLPWYVTRLIVEGPGYLTAQAALSDNAAAVENWITFRYKVLNEMLWALSPALTVLAVLALGYLIWKRTSGDRLVLLSAGAYIGFYMIYNFHSYYIIPLAPFVAIAVARATYAIARRVPKVVWVHALVLPLLLVTTMLMLAGNKYGLWSPSQVRATLTVPAEQATVYVSNEIAGSYRPAIEYALAPAKVIELPDGFSVNSDLIVAEKGETYLLTSLVAESQDGATLDYVAKYPEQLTGIVVFGYELREVPPNRHFFGSGKWSVRWRGAPYFGVVERSSDTYIRLYTAQAVRDFVRP